VILRRFARFLLRRRYIATFLRNVYSAAREEYRAIQEVNAGIPEATPIECRPSTIPARLNLLIPALAVQHVFGGISTALELFQKLCTGFENARIIMTEQRDFTPSDSAIFSDWTTAYMEMEDAPGRFILPAGDRAGRTLAVGAGDRFVATAWWTAVSARAIQLWQYHRFGATSYFPFVYLIQDFEPGFYAWSSRYALAESTYHHADDFIAVFNSSGLKQFFDEEGYFFPNFHVFEPRLNTRLLRMHQALLTTKRERRVLVYGRPNVPRNAFEIIVMGLKMWSVRNPEAPWEFVSVGELHAPIELGGGRSLVSLGKLSLEDYAMEMNRCRIGISLMISPHPSYPPLEMAALGMVVITNGHKGKDLSHLCPNIHSLNSLSPKEIADTLDKLIDQEPSLNDAPSLAWQNYLSGAAGITTEMTASLLDALFPLRQNRENLAQRNNERDGAMEHAHAPKNMKPRRHVDKD
jgi:hypothetical protein